MEKIDNVIDLLNPGPYDSDEERKIKSKIREDLEDDISRLKERYPLSPAHSKQDGLPARDKAYDELLYDLAKKYEKIIEMENNKNNIEKFFMDPEEAPKIPGNFSTLYLLRRDINRCFCNSIIWPGTMCILAGIDLLGKFYVGDDSKGKVGERFDSFLQAFIVSNGENYNILYSLRNSMLHSFGLYDDNHRIILNQDKENFIREDNGSYIISVYILRERFEDGIKKFKFTLVSDKNNAKENFNKMFPKYGIIKIG